jgi:hypothetical protein
MLRERFVFFQFPLRDVIYQSYCVFAPHPHIQFAYRNRVNVNSPFHCQINSQLNENHHFEIKFTLIVENTIAIEDKNVILNIETMKIKNIIKIDKSFEVGSLFKDFEHSLKLTMLNLLADFTPVYLFNIEKELGILASQMEILCDQNNFVLAFYPFRLPI